MRKLVLLFLFTFGNCSAFAQALLVANNNPGATTGTNVFTGATALQDAHDAATAGDTIYVVPSSTSYGGLSITKEITIFGVGIRPFRDAPMKSPTGTIFVDADDVRISGIVSPNSVQLAHNISVGMAIERITIENSRFGRIGMSSSGGNVGDLIIRNVVLTGVGQSGSGITETHLQLLTTSNTSVSNSAFFDGNVDGFDDMVRATGVMFQYNLFVDDSDEQAFDRVVNCTFDHNIFYGVAVNVPATSSGNNWNANLSFGSAIGNGNVFNTTTDGNFGDDNITGDPLFANLAITAVWSNSHDFSLGVGSPALSTSVENVTSEDMGPSGGSTPFDFEGNLLPLIQSITIPAAIPVGTDLPVNIKAKGN